MVLSLNTANARLSLLPTKNRSSRQDLNLHYLASKASALRGLSYDLKNEGAIGHENQRTKWCDQ